MPSNYFSIKVKKKVDRIIAKNKLFNEKYDLKRSKKKKFVKKTNSEYEDILSDGFSLRKYPTLFRLHWTFFLPLFIGFFLSWYHVNKVYGIIRSASCFDKTLYKRFRIKYIILIFVFFQFIIGDTFLIVFFTPLINIPSATFFSAWSTMGSHNGFFNDLATNIFTPFFNSYTWVYSLLIFIFYSIFNYYSLIAKLLFNHKSKNYIRLIILFDNLKMKLNHFISN